MQIDDVQPLMNTIKHTWLPSLLVDEHGMILSYSSFFSRALRGRSDHQIIDVLPELNFIKYKKLWKDRFGACKAYTPKMDILFAENQAFPSRLQFLPVSDQWMLVIASLPSAGTAFNVVPTMPTLQHTIIWETNLADNRCLISGGDALQVLGLESGIHQLTRTQLRHIINKQFTKPSQESLFKKWKAAGAEGKSFELELKLKEPQKDIRIKLHGRAARSKLSIFCLYGHLEISSNTAALSQAAVVPEEKLAPSPDFILAEAPKSVSPFDFLKSVDTDYQKVIQQVEMVAGTDSTVLITGETGTGKELLARAVYQRSSRTGKPFLKVNCGALPEDLIESQLFGHEKGAFTGAHKANAGFFSRADKGTIFLDEIGELSLKAQAKLLRVLQEGTFTTVGGSQMKKIDVRVIAATNRDLQQEVKANRFRADLYFRVCVFPIHNLPLRSRRDDLKVLLPHFVQKFSQLYNKPRITKVSGATMSQLMEHAFPGNIRELENLVERAVILCKGETLSIPVCSTD